MADDALKEQFKLACEHFASIHQKCTNNDKLKMYGLFNQATNGDCTAPAPSGFDMVGKAKWDAWTRNKGVSAENAMKRYISNLREIDPEWAMEHTLEPTGEQPADLKSRFEAACAFAKKSSIFANFAQRTILYAYYKQAVFGPCNQPCPWVWQNLQRARWTAWSGISWMSQQEAMERYLEHVNKMAPGWDGDHPHPSVLRAVQEEEEEEEEEEKEEEHSPAGSPREEEKVYIVTGATGFLGKHLLTLLLKKRVAIYCLCRSQSITNLLALSKKNGSKYKGRVVPLIGDITAPNCGVDAEVIASLAGKVEHVYHLAAVYNLEADEEANRKANVEGTEHVLELVNAVQAKALQYVSSIAVAGDFKGIFTERMFDEGQHHDHAYLLTKFLAEKVVRQSCKVPYRIYRPGVVIGSSVTGEADKIDGPYYLFPTLQKLRANLPQWVVLPSIQGDPVPLVPVDYVVKALDAISHMPGLDGRIFHLVDSNPLAFVDMMNVFAQAAHAPSFSSKLTSIVQYMIPAHIRVAAQDIPIVANAPYDIASGWLGIPRSVLEHSGWKASFDDSETQAVLQGTGIRCPSLKSYAWKVWDYYERKLDPKLDKANSLANKIRGKIIVVTGASDGIGNVLVRRLAKAGAIVIMVARSKDKLEETQNQIQASGGKADSFVGDLSDDASREKAIKDILAKYGHVDILINNAGRSIRRSVEYQYDRFHDFQRTITLNYYGSLGMILGFLPSMRARKSGHIINISSIGCVTNAPRFGAYIASKSALDGFSRCISGEIASDQVCISTIYMPLVQTKMVVSKGNKYDHMHLLTTAEACQLVERAIMTKQRVITTFTGRLTSITYAIFPGLVEMMLNQLYKLEPEAPPDGVTPSEAAQGSKEQLTAIRQLLKGALGGTS